LDGIKMVKEIWAKCYMKDVFALGMRSTQLSESLNSEPRGISNLILTSFDFLKIWKGWWKIREK
jgi:zinc finger SWIM domain-containing protein 3